MTLQIERLNPPMRLSPFGMETCSICDAPTTHTIPTETNEFLPYCAHCAKDVKTRFPDVKVYLYSPSAAISET